MNRNLFFFFLFFSLVSQLNMDSFAPEDEDETSVDQKIDIDKERKTSSPTFSMNEWMKINQIFLDDSLNWHCLILMLIEQNKIFQWLKERERLLSTSIRLTWTLGSTLRLSFFGREREKKNNSIEGRRKDRITSNWNNCFELHRGQSEENDDVLSVDDLLTMKWSMLPFVLSFQCKNNVHHQSCPSFFAGTHYTFQLGGFQENKINKSRRIREERRSKGFSPPDCQR